MVVECNKNICDYPILVLPNSITGALCENNFIASTEWYTVGAEEVGFGISIGKKYCVYGLLQYLNQNRFLLMDDNNMPGFFPSILFNISRGDIPSGWVLQKYEISGIDLILITDPMLINSYEKLKSMIEYGADAIKALLNYKQFILEYGT